MVRYRWKECSEIASAGLPQAVSWPREESPELRDEAPILGEWTGRLPVAMALDWGGGSWLMRV